jgi:hypothetical protein
MPPSSRCGRSRGCSIRRCSKTRDWRRRWIGT